MRRGINLLYLLLVCMASCKQDRLSPVSYINYFESAEAPSKEVKAGETKYRIRLVPPEYFALKEAGREGAFSQADYGKRISQIGGNTYFIIEIQSPAAEMTTDQKTRAVSYYELYAVKQLRLTIKGFSSMPPSYVHFEDSYGLAPADKLLVCFDHPLKDVPEEMVVSYDDQLLGHPDVRASFSKQDINEIPVLTF